MVHRLPHLHLTAQQEQTTTTVLHPVTIWSWNLLLLSSGPYARISFTRTQENKDKKLMPSRLHSHKEHGVKFTFCDSPYCWRTSLKGRSYTQRGLNNKGRTVLIWIVKEGLTEQPWITLEGSDSPEILFCCLCGSGDTEECTFTLDLGSQSP